jgi:hypothetical protein
MKNQITPRDYELISAYLDNQLGNQERALLESRLKADPELRNELQEITKTRLLIHNLPKLRAPRNYYVRAEAVRVRPTQRLAPVFGIVSAVASILLALVVFGSTFFNTNPQVAMAPAVAVANETLSVQQEVQRSAALPITPTEAAPVVLMKAPLNASPTSGPNTLIAGQTGIATPTTVYLFAYPPTSSPEISITVNEEQTEITVFQCEDDFSLGLNPTRSYINNCPTPTNTNNQVLQGVHSTPAPTSTSTPTPTLSSTPTPTDTPTPISSPTPTSTVMPPSIQDNIATSEAESLPMLTSPNQVLGAGNPTAIVTEQGENPSTTPDFSFLKYLFLTVEISLATIAIIAGITAIILRIRSGR